MDVTEKKEVPAPTVDVKAERAAAIKEERQRVADITRACEAAKMDASFTRKLVDEGVSVDEARKLIIDSLSERQEAPVKTQHSVVVTRDEDETFRRQAQEAILHRANPGKNKLTDAGRNLAGYTLREFARLCLERKGVKTAGMAPMELVGRAFQTSSDFTAVLADSMNKSLRVAYDETPRSFVPWCKQASASDFKPVSRTQLSNFPSLTKVNEHGEFKTYAIEDGKETYSLATYGAIVALTRQAIINDDLSAFDRVPASAGMAAAGLEADLVYAILTSNPLMADGGALFNATALGTAGGHANYKASGGGAPDQTSVGAGKAAMRLQKGSGSNSARILNIVPKFLIVPAALELKGQQLCVLSNIPDAITNGNPFKGNIDLIVEGRLDANSANAWYLAAAPGLVDTIEYCYLEGQQGVFTETEQGFDVDGLRIKARHDFAAKAIDYRGLYKNIGQ